MHVSKLRRLRRQEWMRQLARPIGTMWVWDEAADVPQLVWQEAVFQALSSVVSLPGPSGRRMGSDMPATRAGQRNTLGGPRNG